jgi:hypothetical protein
VSSRRIATVDSRRCRGKVSADRPALRDPRLFRPYYRQRAVFYRPSADGSKLRRPFLSDRYFFIVVRLLRRREKLTEPDFALLARAFNRARALHPFYLPPKPGEGRFGQPPGRLVPPCGIKLPRIRRRERRRIRQPTDGLIVDRVRMLSDPRARI